MFQKCPEKHRWRPRRKLVENIIFAIFGDQLWQDTHQTPCSGAANWWNQGRSLWTRDVPSTRPVKMHWNLVKAGHGHTWVNGVSRKQNVGKDKMYAEEGRWWMDGPERGGCPVCCSSRWRATVPGGTVQDCIMAWISPHSSIWVSNINVTSDASFGMKNNQKLKRA